MKKAQFLVSSKITKIETEYCFNVNIDGKLNDEEKVRFLINNTLEKVVLAFSRNF